MTHDKKSPQFPIASKTKKDQTIINNEAQSDQKTKQKSRRELLMFFGAGASAAGGYHTFLQFPYLFWPTTSEPAQLRTSDKVYNLLSTIRHELTRHKDPLTLDQYLQKLDRYKRALRNMFSDAQLKSCLSDSQVLTSRMQNLNQLVETARIKICQLTAEHYMQPPLKSYFNSIRNFYEALFDTFDHIHIFTTNYDLVPEYIFSKNEYLKNKREKFWKEKAIASGNTEQNDDLYNSIKTDSGVMCESSEEMALDNIQFINGFSDFDNIQFDFEGKTKREEREKLIWDSHLYEDDRIPEGRKTLRVYRLHGCVAWLYDDETSINEKNEKVTINLKLPSSIKRHFERLCVYYPGKEKSIGLDPHAFGFRKLHYYCKKQPSINFIGYAFRDIDIVSVCFNSMHNSIMDHKKILVVNPDMDQSVLCNRLREIDEMTPFPIENVAENSQEKKAKLKFIRSRFPGNKKEINLIISKLKDG
jgi:hypothetical protein